MRQNLLGVSEIETAIRTFEKPTSLNDGSGLLLLINSPTSQSWVYRYKRNGRERRAGLGSYPATPIALAREKAHEARVLRSRGLDPQTEWKQQKRRGVTYSEAAQTYWENHCQNLSVPKNWINAQDKHIFPKIGRIAVADLTVDDVESAFRPIWHQSMTKKIIQGFNKVILYVAADDERVKTDLMDKVRTRIGARNVDEKNQPAIHWKLAPKLWAELPATVTGLSMKLLMLTGVRVDVVVTASWSEFDLGRELWHVPPEKLLKGNRERAVWKDGFEVPLTGEALAVLRAVKKLCADSEIVFPSDKSKSGLISENTHRLWLHNHDYKDPDGRLASAHGLRATFRTWASQNVRPRDKGLFELCLQHVEARGSKTQRAYDRDVRFDDRRTIHEQWSSFVSSEAREASEMLAMQEQQKREMDIIIAEEEGRRMTVEEAAKWGRFDGLEDVTED